MIHTCHAHGCKQAVPARMFVCRAHWHALPKKFQNAIWKEYRAGQEIDKKPTYRYLAVQQLAVMKLAFKPHDEDAARICAGYLESAIRWQQRAIEAGQGDPLVGLVPSERQA